MQGLQLLKPGLGPLHCVTPVTPHLPTLQWGGGWLSWCDAADAVQPEKTTAFLGIGNCRPARICAIAWLVAAGRSDQPDPTLLGGCGCWVNKCMYVACTQSTGDVTGATVTFVPDVCCTRHSANLLQQLQRACTHACMRPPAVHTSSEMIYQAPARLGGVDSRGRSRYLHASCPL